MRTSVGETWRLIDQDLRKQRRRVPERIFEDPSSRPFSTGRGYGNRGPLAATSEIWLTCGLARSVFAANRSKRPYLVVLLGPPLKAAFSLASQSVKRTWATHARSIGEKSRFHSSTGFLKSIRREGATVFIADGSTIAAMPCPCDPRPTLDC